jgi:hypothetical protein
MGTDGLRGVRGITSWERYLPVLLDNYRKN